MTSERFTDVMDDVAAHHPGRIALACASLGWRVLPWKHVDGKKRPALRRWPELATVDVDTITDWWSHSFAGCLCGIATGARSNLWVLDIDVKNGVDGYAQLAELEREHGPLPWTFTVMTPSGGEQRYFRWPAGRVVPNVNGLPEASAVDVKGEGGFVAAPGTRVAGRGDYVVTADDVELVEAPSWLLDLIETNRHRPHDGDDGDGDGDPEARTPEQWLADAAHVPNDRWTFQDDFLFKALCGARGRNLDRAHMVAFGLEVIERMPCLRPAEPWTREQVEEKVDHVREYPPGPSTSTPVPSYDPRPPQGDGLTGFFRRGGGLNVQNVGVEVHQRVRLGRLDMTRDGDAADALWWYDAGVWRAGGATAAEREIAGLLGNRLKSAHVTNTLLALRTGDLESIGDGPPHPDLLNFTNGMLRWSDATLTGHDPALHSTVQLAVPWEPTATCPTFEWWLADVLRHPADPEAGVLDDTAAVVGFALEVLGYLCLNGNPLHKAIMLRGTGRNGKGTFLRIARALLGPANCANVPLQTLGENRFASATLHMKLANIAGDLDARHVQDTAIFKMISGEDPIYAERKNGQPFRFIPWCVPIFSANQTPSTKDTSVGYLSRWEVLPFPNDFTGRTDPSIETKIIATELPGVARLAVEGLRRLMTRGKFHRPEAVERAFKAFEADVDQARAWLADRCDRTDPDAWTYRTDLFNDYSIWANANQRGPLGAQNFYERLELAGLRPKKRGNQRGFAGIKLTSEPTPNGLFHRP